MPVAPSTQTDSQTLNGFPALFFLAEEKPNLKNCQYPLKKKYLLNKKQKKAITDNKIINNEINYFEMDATSYWNLRDKSASAVEYVRSKKQPACQRNPCRLFGRDDRHMHSWASRLIWRSRRRRSVKGTESRTRPSSDSAPSVGACAPAMIRPRVLFPAPFPPTTATSSPAWRSRSTPETASRVAPG